MALFTLSSLKVGDLVYWDAQAASDMRGASAVVQSVGASDFTVRTRDPITQVEGPRTRTLAQISEVWRGNRRMALRSGTSLNAL